MVVVDAEHDVGIHLDEAAIAVVGEARVAGAAASASTVSSLRPRLSTVSIMPGIEARAPERTETSSGFACVAELSAGDALDVAERGLDLRLKLGRVASSCWRRSGCRPRS